MRVAVWGPNLPRSNHPETFHIHEAGCADIARNKNFYVSNTDMGGEEIDVSSFKEIVTYVYADIMAETGDDWQIYAGEFCVFACADRLP